MCILEFCRLVKCCLSDSCLTFLTYTPVLCVEHRSTTSSTWPCFGTKLPADPRSVPTSALQSPQTFFRWSGVFFSSVSLVGSILEHAPLSSLDLGFCLCLSCSSPDFFVCDFVLPFGVKDGPQASVNESLHLMC